MSKFTLTDLNEIFSQNVKEDIEIYGEEKYSNSVAFKMIIEEIITLKLQVYRLQRINNIEPDIK